MVRKIKKDTIGLPARFKRQLTKKRSNKKAAKPQTRKNKANAQKDSRKGNR